MEYARVFLHVTGVRLGHRNGSKGKKGIARLQEWEVSEGEMGEETCGEEGGIAAIVECKGVVLK